MNQLLQLAGAILLLAGYAAIHLEIARASAPTYLAVNFVGGAVLAAVALSGRNWGFLVLEGCWAVISLAGMLRPPAGPSGYTGGWLLLPVHDPASRSQGGPRRAQSWRDMLPPPRAARFQSDELSSDRRLTRLFRDSYAAAQGRQWLQPHVVWWILKVLRHNGISPDWRVLDARQLTRSIVALGLPSGHAEVHPRGQTAMNFGFWWPVVGELARHVYRPWRRRVLPDETQLHDRAWRLGLRPWMSSASVEEMSGIVRALTVIREHDRRGRLDPDELMVRFLLPELLIADLHWLHAPSGRPRTGNRQQVEVVLLSRYDAALSKWKQGRYVTPLEHMYLRAGDILMHLSSLPDSELAPIFMPIMHLYRELRVRHTAASNASKGRRPLWLTQILSG